MKDREFGFKFAEHCLYEYNRNTARLEALRRRLEELRATSACRAQAYEPMDHSGGPGDPVGTRAVTLASLEEQIDQLMLQVAPIEKLMIVLDAPFVLDGTPLQGLATVARLHYFAKMPKMEIAKRLKVSRQTLYKMRVRLVDLVIKYAKIRI